MFWEQEVQERNELARNLHLSPDFFYGEQKMRTLSGGEKVKVQIARILMAKPTVLLLDEPSNDIDLETLIEKTANAVIHLEQIRRKTVCRYTVAHMGYEEYLEQRGAQMQNQLRMALNDKRQEKIKEEKLRRIMQKVERDQALISRQDPAGANVLILDEPTRNFSPLSNPVIREVLRSYGGAIISVSHDRKYIREVCDTVYELTGEGLRRSYTR